MRAVYKQNQLVDIVVSTCFKYNGLLVLQIMHFLSSSTCLWFIDHMTLLAHTDVTVHA